MPCKVDSMPPTSLTSRIKEYAHHLGFDLVGIAPAEPSAHWGFYLNWLENGMAGEMNYLYKGAEKRKDPKSILPSVKSIIAVGCNYASEELPYSKRTDPSRGVISRYAWGDDYHDIMPNKLSRLLEFIKREAGAGEEVEAKIYVDTGPILEREIAAGAGIGWFGKNTNILNLEFGSWFFLGEILINIELEYDHPVLDHCGTCTRCIDACPTGALPEPYVLDSTKCISYLTIELKASIPENLRPMMGNLIYGCDICQDVCPFNIKRAKSTKEERFYPRDGLEFPSLLSLMNMNQEEFKKKFKGSPVKRTKRRGLLRNVAVALGNWKSKAAIGALVKALSDSEPLVRGHAAWALGQIGGEKAHAALKNALEKEKEPQVILEIENALKTIADFGVRNAD